MRLLFDAWCAFSPRVRLFCWCGWGLLLGAIVASVLLAEKTDDLLSRQRAANQQIWPELYRLASAVNERFDVSPASPFSPLSLRLPDAQLLHWQPSALGGELAMRARWTAIPPLFAALAERGMSVTGFSVAPEKEMRVVTLQLESPHEE